MTDHVTRAEAFLAALEAAPGRVLDLGSGGGVPGLVLAERWPEAEVTLVDAQARRVRFLAEAITELGWERRVVPCHARSEELGRVPGHRAGYDGDRQELRTPGRHR